MKGIRIVAIAGAVMMLGLGGAAASTVIGLSIEDQARLSKYVVVGRVVGQQGVEDSVNGLETEVTLKVTSVLKGDVRRGESLVFHTRSGELNGESSVAVGEAEFNTGKSALVFIEEVDGRLYNIGLSMGVWDVAVDARGNKRFTRALRDGLEVVGDVPIERGPVAASEMKRRVALSIAQPAFDNPLLRQRLESER